MNDRARKESRSTPPRDRGASPERLRHRIERRSGASLQVFHDDKRRHPGDQRSRNVVVDCGWGRLLFGHTFETEREIAAALCQETGGRRDIAMYLRDPHVALALAPQELFLDPSHTYRLWMSNYLPARIRAMGFSIRRLQQKSDTDAINHLWTSRQMVPVDPDFIWRHRRSKVLSYFVAEEDDNGRIIGTVMGVDHDQAFDDPENGSSLWCLAVDPQAAHPGIGQALVAHLADFFAARGREFMDLSVLFDNKHAIKLYEKMGFQRVPVFSLKRKNPINEKLFIGPAPEQGLNPYAQIIVDEARRRGISVEVLDAEYGYFALTFGGRRIVTRESLSELTSAVAMARCANKVVTHRLLAAADLRVPRHRPAGTAAENRAFLKQCGRLVVKPADGEQGKGVRVGISTARELVSAVRAAARLARTVMLEEFVEGIDLRIVVIDYKVVAAAVRRPPEITGSGTHRIEQLIEKLSRRRSAATGGESTVPIDGETRRCIKRAGYQLDEVLPRGEKLRVRDTANLHTGGTIHDVTDRLNSKLAEVASRAAREIAIPVVGLDFMVPSVEGEEYVIIEANERAGLANHEPQPTAERFIDLLFPQTRAIDHARQERS